MGYGHVVIVDIEKEREKNKDCITVEVLEEHMADSVRELNGVNVLGEKLVVRRIGEDVTQES